MTATATERFVGLQMGPVNFVDEGIEPLLDMLAEGQNEKTRCRIERPRARADRR